jgi:CubicO group peptidase (beta-lactamase class C family)
MVTPLPLTTHVLTEAVAARVFPGAVVDVGRAHGPLATLHVGHLSYAAGSPAVAEATIYDLASLTKVLATTTVAWALVDAGRIRLADRVQQWVPAWSAADRRDVTLADLLEHSSGLPAHGRYFESLRGRAAFEAAICAEPLVYAPRTRSLYSDPGFMLLGFALENAGGARLDRLFDAWRDRHLGAGAEIRYLPPAQWQARIAPTERDPADAARRGAVHDENAAALGGVAAHAGLFGTAPAVGACARWWLSRASSLEQWLRPSAVPGSSRARGWDTMLPSSSCGTKMSPRAFGHTGFTGTSVWIDPARDLYVAFLSNRVHPTRHGEGIQEVRRALHDAVVSELGGTA